MAGYLIFLSENSISAHRYGINSCTYGFLRISHYMFRGLGFYQGYYYSGKGLRFLIEESKSIVEVCWWGRGGTTVGNTTWRRRLPGLRTVRTDGRWESWLGTPCCFLVGRWWGRVSKRRGSVWGSEDFYRVGVVYPQQLDESWWWWWCLQCLVCWGRNLFQRITVWWDKFFCFHLVIFWTKMNKLNPSWNIDYNIID